jgi:hypothetical protein
MIIAFFYFGFACVCGVLANTRGRNGVGWFALALLISPILAGAFLLALPKREGVAAPTPITVPAPGLITHGTMGTLRTLAVAIIGFVVVLAIVNGMGAPVTRSASVVPSAPGYITPSAQSAPRYIDDGAGHLISEDEAIARVDAAAGVKTSEDEVIARADAGGALDCFQHSEKKIEDWQNDPKCGLVFQRMVEIAPCTEARIWLDWQQTSGKRKEDLDFSFDDCKIEYHGPRSATVRFIASRGVERWPFTLEETSEGKPMDWKTVIAEEGKHYVAMGRD